MLSPPALQSGHSCARPVGWSAESRDPAGMGRSWAGSIHVALAPSLCQRCLPGSGVLCKIPLNERVNEEGRWVQGNFSVYPKLSCSSVDLLLWMVRVLGPWLLWGLLRSWCVLVFVLLANSFGLAPSVVQCLCSL